MNGFDFYILYLKLFMNDGKTYKDTKTKKNYLK